MLRNRLVHINALLLKEAHAGGHLLLRCQLARTKQLIELECTLSTLGPKK